MTIGPIGPIDSVLSVAGLEAPVAPAPAASAESFGSLLTQGLEQLQGLHSSADALAVQAATGDLRDAHDYMIAASKAATATQLTVAVRNKALEAYSEIMRMPV